MGQDTYIAIDIETTGLNPRTDKILEIGAARVRDGKPVENYSTFIRVGMPIPHFITELTGIDDGMAAEGIAIEEAMEQLTEFCGEDVLLGHNILFDYSFLKQAAVNQGIQFERQGIDTLKIARKCLPQLSSRKLESLCRYYGIETERQHRALDDALAASELYKRLRESYYEVEPGVFDPCALICRAKKECPATKIQKGYLIDLAKYHRIDLDVSLDTLTKSEASRLIDNIILQHGRIKR